MSGYHRRTVWLAPYNCTLVTTGRFRFPLKERCSIRQNIVAKTTENLFLYRAYGADFFCDRAMDSLDVVEADAGNRSPVLLEECLLGELESTNLQHEFLLNPIHDRDLTVRYGRLPKAGEVLPEKDLELEVAGLVRFRISSPGYINYVTEPKCEPWQIEFWFLHVFFPIYLSLFRSGSLFHGAAVEKDGRVQAFIGATCSGKSTLTEAMLSRGYRLFADDKFRVTNHDGIFIVHPSHGRFRPYRKTEDLGLIAKHRGLTAMPLDRVFVLEISKESMTPVITEMPASVALSILTEHLLYKFYLTRAQGLVTAASFAHAGMVHRLSRPWGRAYLEETAEYLESWRLER